MNACYTLFGCLLAALAAGQAAAGEPAAPAGLVRMGSEQMRQSGIHIASVRATPQADAADASGSSGVRLSGEAVVPDPFIEVVMATVDGQVQSVLVGPGQAVAAGQPVARLYSQGAIGLQRAWLQARARAEVAATAARRAEELFAAGIVAESRVQAARAELSDAEAARAEQRQLLRLAGMGNGAIDALRGAEAITPVLTIVARASGTVLERLQGAGQTVSAVMSGEIDMLLDVGEVHLSAGDVLVQQSTNHSWVNRGTETCRLCVILTDAEAG